MKKTVLILFFSITYLTNYGQIEKNNLLVSLNGSYHKLNTENGTFTNQLTKSEKNLQLDGSFGLFITNKIVVGLGLKYNWGDETRFSQTIFNEVNQFENLNIKSNILMPSLFIGYYQPIIKNLFLSGNLRFNYGVSKSILENNYISFRSTSSSLAIHSASKFENKVDIFQPELCPELSYFITPKLALNLGFGGVYYSITDWKSETSNWIVSLNPQYWTFGVKLSI